MVRSGKRDEAWLVLRHGAPGREHEVSVLWDASERVGGERVLPTDAPAVGAVLMLHVNPEDPGAGALDHEPERLAPGWQALLFTSAAFALWAAIAWLRWRWAAWR